MLARARGLLGLAAGHQQQLQGAAVHCASYSVSSRDVAEANQELEDFFGAVHTSRASMPPAPAHTAGSGSDTESSAGPGPSSALTAGHGSPRRAAAPGAYGSTAAAAAASHAVIGHVDAVDAGAAGGLQAFSSYISGGAAAGGHGGSGAGLPPPPLPASQMPGSLDWRTGGPEHHYHRHQLQQYHAHSPHLTAQQPGQPGQHGQQPGQAGQPGRVLSHIDASGSASMVDVSEKAVTRREAQASCVVSLGSAYGPVAANSLAKGDVLKVAQLAGIGGAKATASLIPLCHNIPLAKVDVQLRLDEPSRSVVIRALARSDGKTGVEMEALTAAAVAALTVYDMAKAAAADMVVGQLQLDYKAGGRSGTYLRAGLTRADLLPSARPPL